MLTVPLRTPLMRLPVECHVEAVSIFKLVGVCPATFAFTAPAPVDRPQRPSPCSLVSSTSPSHYTQHLPGSEASASGTCPPLWAGV